MNGLNEFLELMRRTDRATGDFLAILNVLIGRTIEKSTGEPVSKGLTWREMALWLRKLRWDKDAIEQLDLDPKTLPPRDRERFWYHVIARAQVGSEKATRAGDQLAVVLKEMGYKVGPAPH